MGGLRCICLVALCGALYNVGTAAFSPQCHFSRRFELSSVEGNWQTSGGGETAAGAVLGGLLGGPFGAFFGAQVGASIGLRNAQETERQGEMERLGITQQMLDSAREGGLALEQAVTAINATLESLETQRMLARSLEAEADGLYQNAKEAVASSDESGAKQFLIQRERVQERLKASLVRCTEESKRLQVLTKNKEVLEKRALEIEALLKRAVAAKASEVPLVEDVSSDPEDPLLLQFRELGID